MSFEAYNWFEIGPNVTEGLKNSASVTREEILYWFQICIEVK